MQVNLTWSAVANALFYRIYRSIFTGGPYTLIAQSNPNPNGTPNASLTQVTYQDGPGNLVNGQSYFYRVSTVTVDGESSYSTPETAAVAPLQPPAPVVSTAVIT
jgi:hypothetical protein